MNQHASSSNIPDVFEPAFEWGEGHMLRFSVAEKLTQGQFAAPTIVVIDSCFTQAVYGQHADRHDERRIHNMQTLHINNEKLDDDANLPFLQMYESLKTTLFDIYTHPDDTFNAVQSLAKDAIEFFPSGVQTQTGIDALSWCVGCTPCIATLSIKLQVYFGLHNGHQPFIACQIGTKKDRTWRPTRFWHSRPTSHPRK
jgi:hypothetical protein